MISIDKIEALAGFKIRRGFDKFLNDALKYFGLDKNINEKQAQEVILFINKSHSKLSESYWILRTNKQKNEYSPIIESYRNNLVESSYKHTNRKTVQSDFNKKNYSRGYSGWIKIRNEKIYVRSKNEYIYLIYFDKVLPLNWKIKSEERIYHYKDYSYKPDFFIYNDENKLIKIYEIKDNKKSIGKKYKIFEEFFEKNKIEFEIVHNSNLILKQNPEIKSLFTKWKNKYAIIPKDMSGENNPMYGVKQSKKTKRLISEKAKKRWDEKYSDEIKQKIINSLDQTSSPERMEAHREMCKEREAKKRNIAISNYNKNKKKCSICNCNLEFELRHRKTCSEECNIKLSNINRAQTRLKKQKDNNDNNKNI